MSSFVEGMRLGLRAGGAVFAFLAVAMAMVMVVSMVVFICDGFKEEADDDGGDQDGDEE